MSYERILKISDDHQQITLPDSRFYQRNGDYYPSITHVLSSYPKGKHFEDWLKKVGYASDYIVKKAAEEGTQTHELCEDWLNGEECTFLDKYHRPKYQPHVWKMFLAFVNFWETYKPTLIETEVHLFSDEIRVAGTCDLVVEINGVLWVLDLKTSNHLQITYDLQTAVYSQCYEECYGKTIQRRGILWLKSKSRGEDKSGKRLKGKNWEVVESDRSQQANLDIFMNVKALFDLENPAPKPHILTLKTTVKREV
jgi:ATP-dependent exoDNAse (exonuclease V) beta subunit